MLAFLDVETTGLDIEHDDVLEVACLVTNDRLDEIARYQAVVMACREFYALPEIVRDMHAKSGLWVEANGPDAKPLLVVDAELAAFLREHAVKIDRDDVGKTTIARPQLAGNGIHFDRGFMRRCLRKAEAELHHRQLDVTSVNELARRFWPAAYEARPRPNQNVHRAMDDVEKSLAVAHHYALHFSYVSPTRSPSTLMDDAPKLAALIEAERDAYRAMICDLLASAHPHPTEHPTMTKQWERARALLKDGPPLLVKEDH